MKTIALIGLGATLLNVPALASESKFSIEFHTGYVYNANQHLSVKQNGHEDINFEAEFDTKPFTNPIYYTLRFGRWSKGKAWELELIHDKLYVDDTPPDIQQFEITDGFNLLTINRAWELNHFILRLGAGTVVTHPDITVRGETNYEKGGGAIPKFWQDGYHWGGVALQGSMQKRFMITKNIFLSLEGKLVYANTSVPIANGSVDIINRSAHFLGGIGGYF